MIIEILWKICSIPILILIIKSGHNFAHVTAAWLSWHVQSCDLVRSSLSMQERCVFLEIWVMSSLNPCEMGLWSCTLNPTGPKGIVLMAVCRFVSPSTPMCQYTCIYFIYLFIFWSAFGPNMNVIEGIPILQNIFLWLTIDCNAFMFFYESINSNFCAMLKIQPFGALVFAKLYWCLTEILIFG